MSTFTAKTTPETPTSEATKILEDLLAESKSKSSVVEYYTDPAYAAGEALKLGDTATAEKLMLLQLELEVGEISASEAGKIADALLAESKSKFSPPPPPPIVEYYTEPVVEKLSVEIPSPKTLLIELREAPLTGEIAISEEMIKRQLLQKFAIIDGKLTSPFAEERFEYAKALESYGPTLKEKTLLQEAKTPFETAAVGAMLFFTGMGKGIVETFKGFVELGKKAVSGDPLGALKDLAMGTVDWAVS
ncbi:MAG: hypothetical protein RMH75_07600, partial [Archaeoglobaceae archaeon]|nr:hypothetical protein [Archaeoglobaceae archaeon]MDW7990503.1 hypothetical protein [Archaeoglobaceae archaeon]